MNSFSRWKIVNILADIPKRRRDQERRLTFRNIERRTPSAQATIKRMYLRMKVSKCRTSEALSIRNEHLHIVDSLNDDVERSRLLSLCQGIKESIGRSCDSILDIGRIGVWKQPEQVTCCLVNEYSTSHAQGQNNAFQLCC